MGTLVWIWALLGPLLFGALLTRSLLGRTTGPILFAGAISLGHGAASLGYFALCAAGLVGRGPVLALEVVATAALGALLFRQRGADLAAPTSAGDPRVTLVSHATLAIVVACALIHLVSASVKLPHGGYDAWATWNSHARYMARGGFDAMLSPEVTHPDYPLLVPGTVARAWSLLGDVPTIVPRLVAAELWAATIAWVYGGLCLLRGRVLATAGVALLLLAPAFTMVAASQQADVPLACYVVGAVVSALVARREPGRPGAFAVAGAHLALAAWTKNEGLLLAVVLGGAAVIGARTHLRRQPRLLIAPMLGAVAPLAAVVAFKLMAPSNDLLAAQSGDLTRDLLLDLDRWVVVMAHFAGTALSFGQWWVGTPLLLGLAAAIMARRPRGLTFAGPPLLALLLACAVYVVVYVVSPYNLAWHLATSSYRLLLQLWPAVIVLGAALMGDEGSGLPVVRRPRRSVAAAAALAAAALPNLGWLATTRTAGDAYALPGALAQVEAQLEGVDACLPPRGRIGLFLDRPRPLDAMIAHATNYVLAPRVVIAFTDRREAGRFDEVLLLPGAEGELTGRSRCRTAGGVTVLHATREHGPP